MTDTLLRDAILLTIGGVLGWEGVKWVVAKAGAAFLGWLFRDYY